MTVCIVGLFALSMWLIADNQDLRQQRDNATEQVYILGSHLAEKRLAENGN